jgi:hypothetical protein
MHEKLATATLNYVAVTSALTKRSLDALGVHQAAQKKAADMRPGVLNILVKAGCVAEHQKEAADAMLGSHAETLGLLKTAAEKLADMQAKLTKQASDLGHGEDETSLVSTKPAYDSLNDGYVGRKTGEKKASDEAILRVLQ